MTNPTFFDKVAPHINIQNATTWQAETDKYLWIEYNIFDAAELHTTPARVDYVELKFQELLKERTALQGEPS